MAECQFTKSSFMKTKSDAIRIWLWFVALRILFWAIACPAAAPTYTLTQLGILPGYTESEAVAVNNAGQVAGRLTDSNGKYHAFIYSGGTMTVIGLPSGFVESTVLGINNSGQIAGNMGDGQGGWAAFLYSNGTVSNYGYGTSAAAINDAGQVVGVNNGVAYVLPSTDIGIVSGYNASEASAINNSNQIVLGEENSSFEYELFLDTSGTLQDLGITGNVGAGGGAGAGGPAINDFDQIIGTLANNGDPFLYSNGTVTDLGSVLGYNYNATLYAINDSGEIVGVSSSAAFVYISGTRYYLNNLSISGGGASDWNFLTAQGINASGQIVGQVVSAALNIPGEAYLLIPISSTYTITVSASPASGGTVSGGGTFAAGTSRTVKATANSGYAFTNWTEFGIVVSTTASYTFILNGTSDLVANFINTNTPPPPINMVFTNLYSFSNPTGYEGEFVTNGDGAYPYSSLVLSGNTLYGTAVMGGTNANGTVFKISIDGTGFTTLHTFSAYSLNGYGYTTNGDGAMPQGQLTLSGATLYGTTEEAGNSGSGTVFKVNIDGSDFTTLYNFSGTTVSPPYTNNGGAYPLAGVILSGNTLYGTTLYGGTNGNGIIFSVNTNGSDFRTVHTFAAGYITDSSDNITTNSDGANPYAGLIVSNNTLYGTTYSGGRSGWGTVFKVNTNGGSFTKLYEFTAPSGGYPASTNIDGASPEAGLILSGNTLYGTTFSSGGNGRGTVFALNSDGSGFTNLYNMSGNSSADLVLSGNTLYGTIGNEPNYGSVFALNTDGSGFTNLYIFTSVTGLEGADGTNSDGADPWTGLILSGNSLYGTAVAGGIFGNGTVFRLSFGSFITPTGSLTVTLSPSGAVTENAEWQVEGGALFDSGATDTNLSVGSYTLLFKSIPGWITPSNQTVNISAQVTTMASGVYIVPKPALGITNVISGLQVSNANFLMKGTATDNVTVASVYCQLNGAGWVNPTTFVGNMWSDNVTLNPGTNQFQAYAVDTSGYISATNLVNIVYVLSATLSVSTNGAGSLSPNDNGALLQIGKNCSITATPVSGSGFMFANWTGGTSLPLSLITNGATLQFLMLSNLMLQASFVDTNNPLVSITNVVSGVRVSNANFTVLGTATDNVAVASVYCQLNGSGWGNASGFASNHWSDNVRLNPGTNQFQAFAVDTSGNYSLTSNVTLFFAVTNQLQIRALGLGTISPNYSNAWLDIGQNYSITSSPAFGFVATNWIISTNWIGSMATNSKVVQFMMESNLTLEVNFVDVTRPTNSITSPANGQHTTNALATVLGKASDNWKVAGVWYQLNNGPWSPPGTTNGWTNWTTTLPLIVGTNTLKAYAMDLAGNLSTTSSVSVISSNTFKLQLAFTNAVPLRTNGLVFSLELSKGLNGHIQVSTNLTSWTTLTNFMGTNSSITFRDPAATNSSQRFYRAVIP